SEEENREPDQPGGDGPPRWPVRPRPGAETIEATGGGDAEAEGGADQVLDGVAEQGERGYRQQHGRWPEVRPQREQRQDATENQQPSGGARSPYRHHRQRHHHGALEHAAQQRLIRRGDREISVGPDHRQRAAGGGGPEELAGNFSQTDGMD